MKEATENDRDRAVDEIVRGLADRWLRYHDWLELAEAQVSHWLEPDAGEGAESATARRGARPDIRLLNTAVTTLRRIIESRRLLIHWVRDERRNEHQRTESGNDGPEERVAAGLHDERIHAVADRCSEEEPPGGDEDEMQD